MKCPIHSIQSIAENLLKSDFEGQKRGATDEIRKFLRWQTVVATMIFGFPRPATCRMIKRFGRGKTINLKFKESRTMKRIMLLAVLFSGIAVESSRANLGMTAAEVETKYGHGIETNLVPGSVMRVYHLGSDHVLVTYLNNISAAESLIRGAAEQSLSDAECLAFAATATGKTNWVEFKSENTHQKNWSIYREFYAEKMTYSKEPDAFVVLSKAMIDKIAAESKDEAKSMAKKFAAEDAANPGKGSAKQGQKPAAGDAKVLQAQQQWADRGDAYGQYKMGMRYLTGDGVEKDEKKGRDLLTKAAKQDYQPAKDALAKLPKE